MLFLNRKTIEVLQNLNKIAKENLHNFYENSFLLVIILNKILSHNSLFKYHKKKVVKRKYLYLLQTFTSIKGIILYICFTLKKFNLLFFHFSDKINSH